MAKQAISFLLNDATIVIVCWVISLMMPLQFLKKKSMIVCLVSVLFCASVALSLQTQSQEHQKMLEDLKSNLASSQEKTLRLDDRVKQLTMEKGE